jgi:hypothetical protein
VPWRGIDPGDREVETRKTERVAQTLPELAEAYLEKWARPRKRSAAEDERILRKDVIVLRQRVQALPIQAVEYLERRAARVIPRLFPGDNAGSIPECSTGAPSARK